MKIVFVVFPGRFILNPSSHTFRSMIRLELIFAYSMGKGLRLLTPISIFSCPKTFAKNPFLSLFHGLGDMGLFPDSFLFRFAFVVFAFLCGSLGKPKSHRLDYHSFIGSFKIRCLNPSTLFFFKTGYSFLQFHNNFRTILSISSGQAFLDFSWD